METQITPTQTLSLAGAQPLDQNPALAYLAGLNTDRSRSVMRRALDGLAAMLIPTRDGVPADGLADALTFPWAALRYQHVTALRARMLADGLKPATVNMRLSALRGTLRWHAPGTPRRSFDR